MRHFDAEDRKIQTLQHQKLPYFVNNYVDYYTIRKNQQLIKKSSKFEEIRMFLE